MSNVWENGEGRLLLYSLRKEIKISHLGLKVLKSRVEARESQRPPRGCLRRAQTTAAVSKATTSQIYARDLEPFPTRADDYMLIYLQRSP